MTEKDNTINNSQSGEAEENNTINTNTHTEAEIQ